MSKLLVISLLSLLSVCLGQIVEQGQCDTIVSVEPNFNIERFAGRWYEIEAYPDSQSGTCNKAFYNPTSTTINIQSTQVVNQLLQTTTITATPVANANFAVSVVGDDGVATLRHIVVLTTDYDTYALLYSCRNTNPTTREVFSWKLGRQTTLPATAVTAINNAINAIGSLNAETYVARSHTLQDCVFQLPGQCDTSIRGVPNFRPTDYVGEWLEIARYPQVDQTGQCARAEYTALKSGAVHVLNSEVINQALFTQEGEATIASTDGIGQLNVVFEVAGQTRTANYYILETDYKNYALVYSCANLPNGNRQVSSWQLSRNREPSAADIAAINTAINANPDLDQLHYVSTSQTDAACFYYPVYDETPDFIELRGACPTNIRGMPNFNAANYVGNWIEIERYPQIHQTGQCSRARYTALESGAVRVENTEVRNQVLATQLGEATISSNDGHGELEVVFEVNGQTVRSNYYVLLTDYTSFALVYSCANLPNGNRQVGSWKLGRNTTLTPSAINDMDVIISNTEGLRQEYYQTTSQTADSCFYYPTQTEDRVTLPGQCDTQIPAMPAFDVARFGGIWNHIHRYDFVGERSCIATRLRNEDSVIRVNYIEVIGQEAFRREGVGRLTSTTGVGNFSLVMPVDNSDDAEQVDSEIRILVTDYEGFAIAYTCKNVNENYREVGVWQLSRTRTMPPAGTVAVAALVTTRPEFHAPYFRQITHRDDCPEPSSAFLSKSSIIVILVCSVLRLVW